MTGQRVGTLAVCALLVIACSDQQTSSIAEPNLTVAAGTSTEAVELDLQRDGATNRQALWFARTARSGGPLTVFDETLDAFGLPAPILSGDDLALHDEGDEAFDQEFVAAPGNANSGLGPVFDNTSCSACHFGDGRGRPPVGAERFESMLFRASVPGVGGHGGPAPVPGFGTQLDLRAIPGLQPGVQASITYRDSTASFGDGATYSLRVPSYQFTNPYTPLPSTLLFSPRVAPFIVGMGLLENVPDALLLARADPHDRDQNGISGRVNIVWDGVRNRPAIGRFGWKASVASLLQQTAGAYNGDMGITSSLFPAETCEGFRPGCERHDAEVSDDVIEATTFYQASLGVPARRSLDDATVRRGELVFYAAGCAGCHTPTLYSEPYSGPGRARLRVAAVIHPYTDLLLHDMGPALADNRPDFRARGDEWRTPPLWGIGLVGVVNGHTNFLHDGRARSLLEAVLWHGGEAERSREAVRRLPAPWREALVAFLQSL
jgi:CxxC motif-containing protein (DUF1111 family)